MIVRLICGALHGVEAFRVDLEVDYARQGLPTFTLVGLAEGAVREARERVLTALRISSFSLPPARITVNLAPADRPKGGSAYDLPLAMALLAASGSLSAEQVQPYFFAGELSLTGEIKPVPGILPFAMLAKEQGARGMLVAPENGSEAAVVAGLPVYTPHTLAECAAFLAGQTSLEAQPEPVLTAETIWDSRLDFSEVRGQEHAKRAIEIAAAGAHNLLFIGPPGSGKTMLAQRIPTVLPPLSFEEALEVMRIHSVAGILQQSGQNAGGLTRMRPFRAPHHTISEIGLVGGGSSPRPGEVSLAHRGVLFLDELPEYRKTALEVLRQPLEDGMVTISRAARAVSYPADFMLVAAMNPCPCGYRTDPGHVCTCSSSSLERYRNKLSGPLLDRIDMHIEVPAVAYADLRSPQTGLNSATMRAHILQARDVQTQRYGQSHCRTNADLNGALLERHCHLDAAAHDFLEQAVRGLALSARAYTRILRIARTIADLAGVPVLDTTHLAEAINYRTLDRERV